MLVAKKSTFLFAGGLHKSSSRPFWRRQLPHVGSSAPRVHQRRLRGPREEQPHRRSQGECPMLQFNRTRACLFPDLLFFFSKFSVHFPLAKHTLKDTKSLSRSKKNSNIFLFKFFIAETRAAQCRDH